MNHGEGGDSKRGRAITRKRSIGWVESGCFKYGALGSKRQGDEAAVLVVKNELAIISCIRFTDADPERNPYLSWVVRQAYLYGVNIHWYAVEEREGRHTARVQVFQRFPEAQAAIVKRALEQASDQKPWLRTFANFGAQKPKLMLV